MSRKSTDHLLSIAKIGDSSHACDGGSSNISTGSADGVDVGAASALLDDGEGVGASVPQSRTITLSMIRYPRILRHETIFS